ncbi:hypothetical protein H312_00440 [Anncaliia algerae PRA339]|uniref:ISXO2-like transposase domain-containing protein n=1 Tax=Anncaliia algerae PRA339 TaxID=1288291 RepID=A0A059F4G3_9MICR|nr:hypothetical protein H312_00440 [Anncaliia algerae PRA339]
MRENFFCFSYKTRQRNVKKLLLEGIKLGTTIATDCWKGYLNLNSLGFVHITVNNLKNFFDPLTGANTQAIENRWSIYKRKYKGRYINFKSKVSLIFAEFMFKPQYKHDTYNTLMKNYYKFD